MKIKISCLIAAALIVIAHIAYAQGQAARVAVLPFQINASQDLGYLRTGIQDMLSSRLSWDDKVTVIDREAVNQAVAASKDFKGKSLALMVGARVQADYVVYGSLTLIGTNASIDAKVVNVAGKDEPVSFYKQAETIGEVIPQINQFASDVNTSVFKRPAPNQFKAPAGTATPQYASPNNGFIMSSQRIPLMNAQGQGMSYWRSKDFDALIVGMDTGDVNNDGRDELVYVTDHQVAVYQFVNGQFIKLGIAAENKINKFIAVDVADINGNGTPEIFVSALNNDENKVWSFVLEFDGSGYKYIADRSPYLYRVAKSENTAPVLLGQKPENDKGGIFGAPVYRMRSTGSEYITGEMLLKRKMANVLGVTLGRMGDTGETTVAFDNKDYVRLFQSTGRPSWTGVEKMGGNIDRYLVMPLKKDESPTPQYFPARIRVYDTDQDGKPEIITSVNHDRAMNLVEGFRTYSKARMQALAWDSLGLQPIWESRYLSGRISDFFIADFDNDGTNELVISLVKEEKGAFMDTGAVSMIVAFDLNPAQK